MTDKYKEALDALFDLTNDVANRSESAREWATERYYIVCAFIDQLIESIKIDQVKAEAQDREREAFETAYCYGLNYGKYEGDHGSLEEGEAWNDYLAEREKREK